MIEILNAFLSYLVLVLFIVLVAGVAIFIGITLRKRKNEKDAMEAKESETVNE